MAISTNISSRTAQLSRPRRQRPHRRQFSSSSATAPCNRSEWLWHLAKQELAILCKTYPSPSVRYAETSCVAGLEEAGKLIRLYPVPFRLIADAAKFKKWQWISAQVEKTNKDRRPESHRIGVDTIVCDSEPLDTRDGWASRRKFLDGLEVFNTFVELDQARTDQGTTLGLLRPARVLGLDITACAPDWTDEEKKS